MEPYYQDDLATIYKGDCLDILPELTSSVAIVCTDPPYTFGLASTYEEGKAGSWADLMNNATWYAAWLGECRRLTTNAQGCAWVFTSWRSLPVLMRAASMIPWIIESKLIWDKMWIGPGGTRGLRPSYEEVALLCHRGFALPNRGLPDIWQEQWSSHKPTGHPAEKPLGLIGRILQQSAPEPLPEGRYVLDPFCGSGTTLVAAKLQGKRAVGIEFEERWCELAANRLRQGALALDGPAQLGSSPGMRLITKNPGGGS